MTEEELKNLSTGDIIRHKARLSQTYVVMANYGNRITAVQTVDVTNASEWELRLKARYEGWGE